VIREVLPYAVDNQVKQLVRFMQEERHSQIPNLLFRVLVCGNQVHGLQVSEIHVPSQDVDVQQLADILLLVVAGQAAALELRSDVRELLVYALLFQFPRAGVAQVGYEGDQTAHGVVLAGGPHAAVEHGGGCLRHDRWRE
jgi:hypothetical protein